MLHNELSSLASLLWITLRNKSLPLQVSPSSFELLSSFFEVKVQKAKAPVANKQNPPLPQESANKRVSAAPPPPLSKRNEPKETALPTSIQAPEETRSLLKEKDKKFERILPIKKELPFCKRSSSTQASPTLFEKRTARQQWGVVTFFPAHTKEESLSLVYSIQTALVSKLSISLHTLEKEDEHFATRLQAASSTLHNLLIFGEPHAQAHVEKYFYKLVSLEKPPAANPPLKFLGNIVSMPLYFVPLSLSLKEDLPAKKSLWLALQHLAKSSL